MESDAENAKRTRRMNRLYFTLFFLIVFAVYFGLNYYLYARITGGLQASHRLALYLKIFFVVMAVSFILGEYLKRTLNFQPLLQIGLIWLGIIAIGFSVFLLKDILSIIILFKDKVSVILALTPGMPVDWSLRTVQATIGGIVLTLLLVGISMINVAFAPRLKELTIPIKKLPAELSGFTIVQLTDLHIESPKSAKWLSSIVDRTNALKPDLIVITGDLLDENICEVNGYCEILKKLKSKYGLYGITGNHEFYAGVDMFMNVAKEINMTVLRNQHISIANNSIELVGIDDPQGHRFGDPQARTFGGKGSDLDSAIMGVDLTKPVILLAHQPDIFDRAVNAGVDLQLSGHTHAGQIPPVDLIIQLYFKYPYGLYHKDSAYLYTSSGTGIWGPPMRLFSRSEIVKITLTPEKN